MKAMGVAFEGANHGGGGAAENIIKQNKKCLINIIRFSPTQNRNSHLENHVVTSLTKVYT